MENEEQSPPTCVDLDEDESHSSSNTSPTVEQTAADIQLEIEANQLRSQLLQQMWQSYVAACNQQRQQQIASLMAADAYRLNCLLAAQNVMSVVPCAIIRPTVSLLHPSHVIVASPTVSNVDSSMTAATAVESTDTIQKLSLDTVHEVAKESKAGSEANNSTTASNKESEAVSVKEPSQQSEESQPKLTWQKILPPGSIYGEDWALYPSGTSSDGVNVVINQFSDKPVGCKTLFIGNLPKEFCSIPSKMESILFQIFSTISPPVIVRVNKRGFAHLRYSHTKYVEKAIEYSGYTFLFHVKSDQPSSKPVSSSTVSFHRVVTKYVILAVDYAQNKLDEQDWNHEIKERVAELERTDMLSRHPLARYGPREAQELLRQLKNNVEFEPSCDLLQQWLDRVEMDRRVATDFYTMLQVLQSHVRRLQSERETMEQKLAELQAKYVTDIAALNKT